MELRRVLFTRMFRSMTRGRKRASSRLALLGCITLLSSPIFSSAQDDSRRQDEEPRIFIEQLKSDEPPKREAAYLKLKALGASARPELEKASESSDRNLAQVAKKLLRILSLRDTLPPRLKNAFPGIEEKIVEGGHACTEALLEATGQNEEGIRRHPELKP